MKEAAVTSAKVQVLPPPPDLPRRNSSNDSVRGYVAGDDRACADDRTFSDGHPRKNHCPSADKDIVFDNDGALSSRVVRGMHVVIRCQDADFGGDGNILTNGDAAAVVQAALLINDAVLLHPEAALRVEPRVHEDKTAIFNL